MNLLSRSAQLLLRSTFTITFRLVVILFRLFLPYFLTTIRIMRSLVFISLTATVNGPTQYTDRLASEWTQNLLLMGVSRDYLDQIFVLCRFVARSMVVMGWVVATLFLVAILRVVFGILV